MSDFWAPTAQFSENGVVELLSSSSAQRRESAREDRGSVSYRNRHNRRFLVRLTAFMSVAALLFLVSRCVALSMDAAPKHAERRLAGGQEAIDGDESRDAVEQVCGGAGSQSAATSRRRGRSVGPSEVDMLATWSEYGEEPPKKKRQGALDGRQVLSSSPSHTAERAAKPAETEGDAEKLRQSILLYVEQTLAEKDEGLEEEHWLLEPYMEVQLSEEKALTQSLSTVEYPITALPVDVGTSALTYVAPLSLEESSMSSALPGEGSPQCNNVLSGITAPSPDAMFSPRGAVVVEAIKHLPDVQGGSRRPQLLKYIVGKPGAKGAYMLLASEVSNFRGRPAITIISTPLRDNSAPQQTLREGDLAVHPFYKLPSVAPSASVRGIVLKPWPLSRRRTSCESKALLGIKELFKKPLLDSKDLERLMQHLEQLVEYAIQHVKEEISSLSPKCIVAKLGFALLVTDAIFAASEVLGKQAKRAEWWPQVIDTLPVYMGPSASGTSNERARQNLLLARFLHSALEFYRCGSRPPASALVPLKQILLCTSAAPSFRRGPWAHFMADDTEWQQSQ